MTDGRRTLRRILAVAILAAPAAAVLWGWWHGGSTPLVRGTAVDAAWQSWVAILESSASLPHFEDSRTLPIFLFQGVWVAFQSLGGASPPEIARVLAEREEVWTAGLAVLGWAAALATLALLLARRSGGFLSAALVALSPLWLNAIFEPGPAVFTGLAFVVLMHPRAALPAQVAALGLLLGITPWAAPAALGVAAGALVAPSPELRRRWSTLLVLALPAACLWNPQILLDTGRWWELTLWHHRVMGFAGPVPSAYVATDTVPGLLTQGLGYLSPLFMVIGLAARLRRPRHPRTLVMLCLALAVGAGAAWGRVERSDMIALVPILAILTAGGALQLYHLAERRLRPAGLRPLAAAVAAVILIPVAAGGVKEAAAWRLPSAEQAAYDWLRENKDSTEWIVIDHRIPSPPGGWSGPAGDAGRRILRIPYQPQRPDLYRAAYWLGWYEPFDKMVLSARTIGRLWDMRERYPDIFAFYTRALVELEEVVTWGGSGWRDAKISVLALPADSLGQDWRRRLQSGPDAGLQPDFLTLLGGTLMGRGLADQAAALLQRAHELGARSRALYLNLGRLFMNRQEHRDAAELLAEALQLYPGDPALLQLYGANFAQGGLWHRAREVFERLIAVAPWNAQARLDLAAALLMEGERERARMVLADYLRRVPPEERPPRVESLIGSIFPEGLAPR
ncbi:MAG: hypothetical protein GF355_14400 [Candidatus Eisenbacteria bacterium]|nr:hypothetical protein [Candidatus Eisenbacteria bacterium]